MPAERPAARCERLRGRPYDLLSGGDARAPRVARSRETTEAADRPYSAIAPLIGQPGIRAPRLALAAISWLLNEVPALRRRVSRHAQPPRAA